MTFLFFWRISVYSEVQLTKCTALSWKRGIPTRLGRGMWHGKNTFTISMNCLVPTKWIPVQQLDLVWRTNLNDRYKRHGQYLPHFQNSCLGVPVAKKEWFMWSSLGTYTVCCLERHCLLGLQTYNKQNGRLSSHLENSSCTWQWARHHCTQE